MITHETCAFCGDEVEMKTDEVARCGCGHDLFPCSHCMDSFEAKCDWEPQGCYMFKHTQHEFKLRQLENAYQ